MGEKNALSLKLENSISPHFCVRSNEVEEREREDEEESEPSIDGESKKNAPFLSFTPTLSQFPAPKSPSFFVSSNEVFAS